MKLIALGLAGLSLAAILVAAIVVLEKDKPATHGIVLERLPEDTRQAYNLALEHRDLFVHLPCYCGCAVLPTPHKSLADCFVNGDGTLVSHASSCSTCVEIALEAQRASDQGMDRSQIRALIDEQFSGRGRGTATGYP